MAQDLAQMGAAAVEQSQLQPSTNSVEKLTSDLDRKQDLKSMNISLEASLNKLQEYKTLAGQALNNLAQELQYAPVWSDEEKLVIQNLFIESNAVYSEVEGVIGAVEKQTSQFLDKQGKYFQGDKVVDLYSGYSILSEKLTSYKAKLMALIDNLAKVQKTLPNVSVAETSRTEYEDISRNVLAAVNDLSFSTLKSVDKKKDESPEASSHNKIINYIYNLYNDRDLKKAGVSFVELEGKVVDLKSKILDKNISLADLEKEMEKNKIEMGPEIHELFLLKNYFDLHPGLDKDLEAKFNELKAARNEILEKYSDEESQKYIKEKLFNPKYYTIRHLRQVAKDRILKMMTPEEIFAELDERMEHLENSKGILEGKAGAVAENLTEEKFFAKGEKASNFSEKSTAKLNEQAERAAAKQERIPVAEYESRFWAAHSDLENSYKNYLLDLDSLAKTATDENTKKSFAKYINSRKDYISNYIKDNYAQNLDEMLFAHIQKYLVDQRVDLEKIKEEMSGKEEVIELEANDLKEKDTVVEAFWSKYPKVERKMEEVTQKLMEIRDRLEEAGRPEVAPLRTITGDVLQIIEDFIFEGEGEKTDEEILEEINGYLDSNLTSAKQLEKNLNKVEEVTDDMIIKEDYIKDEAGAIPVGDDMIKSVEDIKPAKEVKDDVLVSKKDVKEEVQRQAAETELEPAVAELLKSKAKKVIASNESSAINKKTDEADKAAEALAAFEDFKPGEEKVDDSNIAKVVPAEEKLDIESALGRLSFEDSADELQSLPDLPKAKEAEGFIDEVEELEESPMYSGTLENKPQPEALKVMGEEEKIIIPPKSVPFEGDEKKWNLRTEKEMPKFEMNSAMDEFKKPEYELGPSPAMTEDDFFEKGEFLDFESRFATALTSNPHLNNWIQDYLEIFSYEKMTNAEMVRMLDNKDFYAIIRAGVAFFDSIENAEDYQIYLKYKKEAQDNIAAGNGEQMYQFKFASAERPVNLTAVNYLRALEKRVGFLNRRVKKDIRERDALKK